MILAPAVAHVNRRREGIGDAAPWRCSRWRLPRIGATLALVAGMLSLRVSKAERRQLQMLRAERGHANLSVTMRVLMGFPERTPGGEPLMEGSDDIDSVAKLCSLVIQMIDRQDDFAKTLTAIARHVGVPQQLNPFQLAAAERNGTPIHPLPDPEKPLAERLEPRGGDRHPDLPPGFAR